MGLIKIPKMFVNFADNSAGAIPSHYFYHKMAVLGAKLYFNSTGNVILSLKSSVTCSTHMYRKLGSRPHD